MSKNANTLPSVDEMRNAARLAGTQAGVHWKRSIASTLRGMSQYDKAIIYRRAYAVSMNIISHNTMDNTLFPALLAKPQRSSIPWNKLQEEYGVDRRYIATAYLAALERYVAREDTVDPNKANTPHAYVEAAIPRITKLKRYPEDSNLSPWNLILSICISGNMDRDYIEQLAATGRFDNTLAGFAPERIAEHAAKIAANVAKKAAGRRVRTSRYPADESWALWRHRRHTAITQKARDIADALAQHHELNATQAQPYSPILRLAARLAMPTTFTLKPRIASLMLYLRKHVMQHLPSATLDALHAEAMHYARHIKDAQQALIVATLAAPDRPRNGVLTAASTAIIKLAIPEFNENA